MQTNTPLKSDYNAFVFDLDGTLAESKSALTPEMATFICGLLKNGKSVGVISGGWMPQFKKQFLGNLNCPEDLLAKLYLMPTCGAAMYIYDIESKEWTLKYEHSVSDKFDTVCNAFDDVFESGTLSFKRPTELWGEQMENRGSQISFSALGQAAPNDAKHAWEKGPNKNEQRLEIVAELEQKFPELSIKVGGATTIDLTKKGIDKQFGMEEFFKIAGHSKDDTLFGGDAIFEGGNDFEATKTGCDWIRVDGPQDILKHLSKYAQ